MKKMDLFCASPASTAISTRPHPHPHPHPHRHADPGDLPRIIKTQVTIPCTPYQLVITPRPKSHCEDGKRIGDQGRRNSSADARDLIGPGPQESSRYLLSDEPLIEPVSEPNRSTTLVPVHPSRHSISSDGSPSSKASYPAGPRDQMVVLRVSLHCKRCESKVRKHLSRMEGELENIPFPFSASNLGLSFPANIIPYYCS